MPVVVKCKCGKQMRVPDEHVGKRMRCPECKEPLLIKAAEPEKKPAATAPAAGKPIAFACSCGKKMQVRAELAGRGVKCPECGKGVKVPGAAPAAAAAPAIKKQNPDEEEDAPVSKRMDGLLAKSAARKQAERDEEEEDEDDTPARNEDEDEDQDEDEDEDDTPRKKGKKGKKKGGSMLPLLLGIGLVLILGAGATWYFVFNVDNSKPIAKNPPVNLPPPGPGPVVNPPAVVGEDLALVPANSAGFITARVADLLGTDLGKQLLPLIPPEGQGQMKGVEMALGLTLADLERVTGVLPVAEQLGNLMPGPNMVPPDFFVVLTTSKPVDAQKVRDLAQIKTPAVPHNGKEYFTVDEAAFYFHSENTVVVGNVNGIRKAIDQGVQPTTEGSLAAALGQAAKQHLFGSILVPTQLAQMKTQIPKQFEDFAPLAEAKQLLLAGNIQGTTVELSLAGDYGMEPAAGAAKGALDKAKAAGSILLAAVPQIPPFLTDAYKNLVIKNEGTQASVNASIPVDMKVIQAAVDRMKGAATRIQSVNNLKQMGIAFHSTHDAQGSFKAAIYDPQGKPLHSWRVAILPYIEQEALYRQLKLDEPWDSEHNKKFHAMMPKIFEMPGKPPQPGMTYYQGFNGPDALCDLKATMGVRFTGVTDGLSNTLLIVEAATPVNWMEPKDIDFMPGPNGFAPTGKVGGHFPGGFNALFADGSVRFLPLTLPPQDFQGTITMSDGKVINLP